VNTPEIEWCLFFHNVEWWLEISGEREKKKRRVKKTTTTTN